MALPFKYTSVNIVLTDEMDNSQWILKVYDGELIIEPKCDVAKRKHKINKIVNEKD